jgi:hypothetical protein
MPVLMLLGILYSTGMISLSSHRRIQQRKLNIATSSNKKKKKKSNDNTTLFQSIGRVLIATFTFYMLVFHSLSNLPLTEGLIYGVHARFWQQPNVIMFMFLSCGVGYVTTFLSHRLGISKNLKPAVACVFVRSIELGLSGLFQQHNRTHRYS